MQKVLGIFTCHNRKKKTENCLKALKEGNPQIEFYFIAVDDHSIDGTKEMLEKHSDVQIVLGDGERYYSGGMRLGINAAKKLCDKYDWILFFNDDVEFVPHSIEKLEALLDKKDKILAGATCGENGELTYGGVLKKSRFRPSFQTVMSGERLIFCDTFNANCVLLPSWMFKALPNIDSKYTHSLGDFDYGLVARKHGFEILVSDFFVGKCNKNSVMGTWKDVGLSRRERIKKKESPKGLPRKEWFHFVKKHYGIISACISSITPYIKIIIKMS